VVAQVAAHRIDQLVEVDALQCVEERGVDGARLPGTVAVLLVG
jgi:hypothetical protein